MGKWNWRAAGQAMLAVGAFWMLSAAPAAAQTPAARQVTFTKDIAPLLQRSCQRCHRPNSVAPMSLITYEEARPYARSMKQRTALARSKWGRGAMPPWFMEKNIGIQNFKDDISLSDEEIATFAAWADTGAQRGDPADMPPPLKFAGPTEWHLGQPDLIVTSPPVFVPAIASDWEGDIGSSPAGTTEDRYVSSVEFMEVSDRRAKEGGTLGSIFVFHHAGVSVVAPEGREGEGGGGSLALHEVGRNGEIFPPTAGRFLPAGSSISFSNTHIHSPGVAGGERTMRIDLGLKLHPQGYKPKYRVVNMGMRTHEIQVLPNMPGQRIDQYIVLQQHAMLVNYEPHLHAAGVRKCLEVVYPPGNGDESVIETLNCAGYDHNWVRNYQYDDNYTPLLPKGTILHMIGWFDTTEANQNNTDGRNFSTWGASTTANMFLLFNKGVYLTEEQYQEELAKRREFLNMTGEDPIGCPDCLARPRRATPAATQ